MGYVQTTGSVAVTGPGSPLTFDTIICPLVAVQVSGSGTANVAVEGSLDGTNFTGITTAGGVIKTNTGATVPLKAIRYNVTTITGTVSITIAAAVPGTDIP